MTKFLAITVAWENRWHFAMPPTVSPWNDIWETRAEISYWWRVTTQWGSAPDWLKQISQVAQPIRSSTQIYVVTLSVWNFCTCFSDVILWGNRWWHCKMSSVFSAHHNRQKHSSVSQKTAVINRKSKNNLPESVFSHNFQPLRQKRHQIVVNNPILMLSFS